MGTFKPILLESKTTDAIDRGKHQEIISNGGFSGWSFFTNGIGGGADEKSLEKQQKNLIEKCREYASIAKVDKALKIIVNEAVVPDVDNPIVINTDKIESENEKLTNLLKDEIEVSFYKILKKLKWSKEGDIYFKDWYIDGIQPCYYEMDAKGIKALRILDPLRLKLVTSEGGKFKEWVYETGEIQVDGKKVDELRLKYNSVIFVESGMKRNGINVSFLYKSLRPINLLQMMENSVVIYTFVRAPQRFLFNIDVTGMSKPKATAYMQNLQQHYNSKFSIDALTGQVKSDSAILSMMENFWLAKTNSQIGGSTIDTIGGGAEWSNMDSVNYFKNEFYESLGVPASRLKDDATFMFGSRTEEIKRDEQEFFKDIKFYRRRYSELFLQLIEIDMISRKICTSEDFQEIKDDIKFVYANDSVYEDAKEKQILIGCLDIVSQYEEKILRWFDEDFLRTKVLKQTKEEIKRYKKAYEKNKAEEPPVEEETSSRFR